ncbi:MAG: BglII/BstYI family type II restriction endonuclease [Magnetovibrionaceae bacterium]
MRDSLPRSLLEKYEVHSFRNAAIVLGQALADDFDEIAEALARFNLTTDMIRTAGGNESAIPKAFSEVLRPLGWQETKIQGDLLVRIESVQGTGNARRKVTDTVTKENFLDGHKIDYVKNRIAFDLEWNSKDQTFDRDLYAFSAFFQCGIIDAAVLVTRSASLNPVFQDLGHSLTATGEVETNRSGEPRLVKGKFGASTTWMGKLLYRLNAGRNGGCPVLAVGISPACISDLELGVQDDQ